MFYFPWMLVTFSVSLNIALVYHMESSPALITFSLTLLMPLAREAVRELKEKHKKEKD